MARRPRNRNQSLVRSPDQVGGGTFAAAQARRDLQRRLMALSVPDAPRRVSAPSAVARAAAAVSVPDPVQQTQARAKRRVQGPVLAQNITDDNRRRGCKPRADGTRRTGSGARRSFVPWCK